MASMFDQSNYRDFATIAGRYGVAPAQARTLWRRIRRCGCKNARLFEAENDGRNYQTRARYLAEQRMELDAWIYRLTADLAEIGFGIDWPGLYPVLTAPDKHDINPF